jgi:hypothetical protein
VGSREQSLALERDGPTLGAPEDRARQLERGAGPGLARDHELAGHHDPALEALEEPVNPATISVETRVRPSSSRPQASGVVASSAPTTNSSRWIAG